MKYPKITLLTKEQIWGSEELEVLKKYGREATSTDLCVLTGARVDSYTNFSIIELMERKGSYITKSLTEYNPSRVYIAKEDGRMDDDLCDERKYMIRPVIYAPEIIELLPKKNIEDDEVEKIELGFYPQNALSSRLIDISAKYAVKTGRHYTFDDDSYRDFNPVIYDEYEYNGVRFIKKDVSLYESEWGEYQINECKLTNGRIYENHEEALIKVSPVVWLVDRKSNLLIAENCLLSGIIFAKERMLDVKYEDSIVNYFLEEFMIKEIFQTTMKMANVEYITNPSVDELLKGYIESDVPILLQKNSIENIRRLNPSIIKLDLKSNLLYEDAQKESTRVFDYYNSLYNTKKSKPSWLKELEEKCKKEIDKLHIICFSNLKEASTTTQEEVMNIIINRKVGDYTLPKNARIVVTSDLKHICNMPSDYLSAFATLSINNLSQNEDLNCLDYSVHPILKAFIMSKNIKISENRLLMASKLLFKNKATMLLDVIGTLNFNSFVDYYFERIITLDDVINNTEKLKLNFTTQEKIANTFNLSDVHDEYLESVLEYIKSYGYEYTNVFNIFRNMKENDEEITLRHRKGEY